MELAELHLLNDQLAQQIESLQLKYEPCRLDPTTVEEMIGEYMQQLTKEAQVVVMPDNYQFQSELLQVLQQRYVKLVAQTNKIEARLNKTQ